MHTEASLKRKTSYPDVNAPDSGESNTPDSGGVTKRPRAHARVVCLKRSSGRLIQGCDVYIGRECRRGGWDLAASKWANPEFLPRDATDEQRAANLARYRQHVLRSERLYHSLPELEGKVMGCWCKPAGCHGDVLLDLLRAYKPRPPLFHMVEESTTRARFRLSVIYKNVGEAQPVGQGAGDEDVIEHEDLEIHIQTAILGTDGLLGPLKPTFQWWMDGNRTVDVECNLPTPPPDIARSFGGKDKLTKLLGLIESMSYGRGAYMVDVRRGNKTRCVEIDMRALRLDKL
ncbi:uncharacterized protein ACA1_020650 [Acanthamoeba castellanii str. Neff]|uniref:DUF4326 domain-containing protein n=1 Tax=Acanthamoeba castellanii (strain ATCC 30010 / Neff) TaxID=1257118 RepID=L8GMA6_ACACF|nr:uncharacterized protein ACA1_020650 [Acanthamoeba castellanii str. Neff]ELR14190.1 hypothetical protein ACA1_020650 [Acanthamoeba castellanii str. Neff]